MPPLEGADQVFVWLEDSGDTVAVCNQPGRIGILNAEDAEAYLPLVRAAYAQDKVVAAMASIGVTSDGLPPATVRVVRTIPIGAALSALSVSSQARDLGQTG
jgi:hypothetical protein